MFTNPWWAWYKAISLEAPGINKAHVADRPTQTTNCAVSLTCECVPACAYTYRRTLRSWVHPVQATQEMLGSVSLDAHNEERKHTVTLWVCPSVSLHPQMKVSHSHSSSLHSRLEGEASVWNFFHTCTCISAQTASYVVTMYNKSLREVGTPQKMLYTNTQDYHTTRSNKTSTTYVNTTRITEELTVRLWHTFFYIIVMSMSHGKQNRKIGSRIVSYLTDN